MWDGYSIENGELRLSVLLGAVRPRVLYGTASVPVAVCELGREGEPASLWRGEPIQIGPDFPAVPIKPMTLFRIAVVNSTEEIGIEAHEYHVTDDEYITFTTELGTTPPINYEMARITAHSVQKHSDGTPIIRTGSAST